MKMAVLPGALVLLLLLGCGLSGSTPTPTSTPTPALRDPSKYGDNREAVDAVRAYLGNKSDSCHDKLRVWQGSGYLWATMLRKEQYSDTHQGPITRTEIWWDVWAYTIEPYKVVARWKYYGPQYNVVPEQAPCGELGPTPK